MKGVAVAAVNMGIPAPCFMASLNYFEGYSSAWLPGNLIQAQRDFFGAHTYERIDEKGTFHTNWEDTQIYDQTKNTALKG